MRAILAVLVLCGVACASSPVVVRVACDRTGSFNFLLPLDGSPVMIKTPACNAECSACGQECSVRVLEQ